MVDFGSDFSGLNDLDANVSIVDGATLLGEDLLTRITTPRGAIWYAPSECVDVGAYINTTTSEQVIEQAAEGAILDDERVVNVEVSVTFIEPDDKSITGGRTIQLTIQVETDEGPFDFVATVDAISASILPQGIT